MTDETPKPDLVIPPTEGERNPKAEEEEKKIKQNKSDRESALAFLELVEQEHGNPSPRFWEVIRDRAIAECGLPLKQEDRDVRPFTSEEALKFQKQTFPYGKYAEMAVATVEKKEGVEFLEKFAKSPTWFQKYLLRYVLWRKANPAKKKGKKI